MAEKKVEVTKKKKVTNLKKRYGSNFFDPREDLLSAPTTKSFKMGHFPSPGGKSGTRARYGNGHT
ncbi:MAG: hypothetical protein NDI62_00325 [Burkholderiales bacterium]|nr:hypothetical protein [Burkholderiales bacterium]